MWSRQSYWKVQEYCMTELEFELEFKKRKLQKRKQRRMELLILGVHLGVVIVLLYWMFGIGMVHGRSMRPAYRDGDLFLYQRSLFGEPDYGDVVVIHRQNLERDIVKRIAGKPGDVIDLDGLGHLTRNGERVSETEILFGEQENDDWITFPYTVPEGNYFCLGDNRPRSEDSRVLGAFSRQEITGKVLAQLRLSAAK